MKRIMKTGMALLVASVMGMGVGAYANEKDIPAVTAKIKKTYPTLQVKDVTYLPEVNLYEVRLEGNNQLTYTNKDIEFFLVAGEIVNPSKKENVSTVRSMNGIAKFMKELDPKDAITFKYGTGERKVVIFTDPDCPFCKSTDREIHNQMQADNVTVSYYFNPLQIPGHEQAPLKAAKIWCAPNKQEAFKNWMLNNILPNNDGSCANPVSKSKATATQMGFNSTPTILFDNGHLARQSLTAEQIRQVLSDRSPIKNPK